MTKKTRILAKNVELELREGGLLASLSCEFDSARYHVWLDGSFELKDDVLYKNPPLDTKPYGPGYFRTRRLSPKSAFGKSLVSDMWRQVGEGGLREKAVGSLEMIEEVKARARDAAATDERKSEAVGELFDALVSAIEAESSKYPDSTDEPDWMKQSRKLIGRLEFAVTKSC